MSETIQSIHLLSGIQFTLGSLSLLIAIFLFFDKTKTPNVWLGIVCFLIAFWLFEKTFQNFWKNSLIEYIFIGPGKSIFIGSSIVLYFKNFEGNVILFEKSKYLFIAFFWYLIYSYFLFFSIKDSELNIWIFLFLSISSTMLLIYFFLIVRFDLLKKIKNRILPKAYKKLIILFGIIFFVVLQILYWDMLNEFLLNVDLPLEYKNSLLNIYANKMFLFSKNVSYVILYSSILALIIYSLTEIWLFKKLILPNDINVSESFLENKDEIEKELHNYFNVKKNYKNPNLTIYKCATDIGITQKELSDYFIVVTNKTFKEFLNIHRVEELKRLLSNKENNQFDIVGLGKECGFASRSTCYRVFRNVVGMTPNLYKKTLQKSF